jgi:hypothetical protein
LQTANSESPTLELHYSSLEALERDYQENLIKGRAFFEGHFPDRDQGCVRVILVRPDSHQTFECSGEVAWINRDGPVTGTGVQLAQLNQKERAELHRFAIARESAGVSELRPSGIQDRIRALPIEARNGLAKHGTLAERVALEHVFGSDVWEALLQNPDLSQAELVRIARNGILPRPLIARILDAAVWLAQPEVRRALLANPRVDGLELERVLKAMLPAERSRLVRDATCRALVRDAAKRLAG